jgi:hypothetical protein
VRGVIGVVGPGDPILDVLDGDQVHDAAAAAIVIGQVHRRHPDPRRRGWRRGRCGCPGRQRRRGSRRRCRCRLAESSVRCPRVAAATVALHPLGPATRQRRPAICRGAFSHRSWDGDGPFGWMRAHSEETRNRPLPFVSLFPLGRQKQTVPLLVGLSNLQSGDLWSFPTYFTAHTTTHRKSYCTEAVQIRSMFLEGVIAQPSHHHIASRHQEQQQMKRGCSALRTHPFLPACRIHRAVDSTVA